MPSLFNAEYGYRPSDALHSFHGRSSRQQPNATIRQMSDEQIAAGRFNPANMYSTYRDEWDLPGEMTVMNIQERLFTPPELVKLLGAAGFVGQKRRSDERPHSVQLRDERSVVEGFVVARVIWAGADSFAAVQLKSQDQRHAA